MLRRNDKYIGKYPRYCGFGSCKMNMSAPPFLGNPECSRDKEIEYIGLIWWQVTEMEFKLKNIEFLDLFG